MRLGTHAMNRNAVCDPALHLFQQEACLGLRVYALFQVVVVVAELRVGVGGVRPHEGGVDKFGADSLVPHGIGTPLGFVVADGLVHHVPFIHLAFPVSDHVVDVVLEHAEKFLFVVLVVVHPVRNLAVPGEGMATDTHAVLLRVLDHLVAVIVVETVFARFGGVEFHLVFGDDNIALCLVNLFVVAWEASAKPLRIQNGADVDVVFICE